MKYKIISKNKYIKLSYKKTYLIIKSLNFKENINTILFNLENSNNKASFHIKKTIISAIYNAKNNFNLDINNIYLKNIIVNKATIKKKAFIRSRGKMDIMKKKTCHITVFLSNIK